MSSYRVAQQTPLRIQQSFDAKIQSLIERKCAQALGGLDVNMGKPGTTPFLAFRKHAMNPDTFALGCKLNAEGRLMEPHLWVYWMTDAIVKEREEKVVVYHRNKFHCDYADKYLGDILRDHFKKPVNFKPDANIKAEVEL